MKGPMGPPRVFDLVSQSLTDSIWYEKDVIVIVKNVNYLLKTYFNHISRKLLQIRITYRGAFIR